mmetsp:Transcript_3276/g.11391  ORF Transcript_3276/g.11391 Transcript_3276/m.11391 type:complete len:265 (+) Transcript_3276:275-1069(+)
MYSLALRDAERRAVVLVLVLVAVSFIHLLREGRGIAVTRHHKEQRVPVEAAAALRHVGFVGIEHKVGVVGTPARLAAGVVGVAVAARVGLEPARVGLVLAQNVRLGARVLEHDTADVEVLPRRLAHELRGEAHHLLRAVVAPFPHWQVLALAEDFAAHGHHRLVRGRVRVTDQGVLQRTLPLVVLGFVFRTANGRLGREADLYHEVPLVVRLELAQDLHVAPVLAHHGARVLQPGVARVLERRLALSLARKGVNAVLHTLDGRP